jgi:hypothetical protein
VKILSLKSTKTCTYSLGVKLPCNRFQHIEWGVCGRRRFFWAH